GDIVISTDCRLRLSAKILRAIIDESLKHDLLLLDIKSENIMVDLATEEVHVVDVAHSKKLSGNKTRCKVFGTPLFMPHEQFLDEDQENQYTAKSASYSTGKTLAEFWFAVSDVVNELSAGMSEIHMAATYMIFAQADSCYDFHTFKSGD